MFRRTSKLLALLAKRPCVHVLGINSTYCLGHTVKVRHLTIPTAQKQDPSRKEESNMLQQVLSPTGEYLKRVRQREISSNLICFKAEELFLQTLQRDGRPSDTPEADKLLSAAIENAKLPGDERIIVRLFSLASQVMMRSGHRLALDKLHAQILKLLDNHETYLPKDIQFASFHVNDFCGQFVSGAVLQANKAKSRLPRKRHDQIQELIKRLDELFADQSVPLAANWISCHSSIVFHCNQQNPEEALRILHWMIDTEPEYPSDLTPRVHTFTTIISAYAKIDPEKSIDVLQWMLTLYEKGIGPAPNTSTFNALLDASAKSKRPDAGQRAEQTLEWMQQMHDTRGLNTAPDIVSWNSVINAWGNTPLAVSAERAETILRHMIRRFQAGSAIEPENITFVSVMNAWAKSGKPEAPEKVSKLLELYREMARRSTLLQVDSYAYSVLLKAYENSDRKISKKQANENILRILAVREKMHEDGVEITSALHNSVIMALCSVSALQAVLYFLETEESFMRGETSMDRRTFNSGLSAMSLLSRQDAAKRTMDVLVRMKEYGKAFPEMAPDQTTFNVILNILSKSPAEDAASRADDLLVALETQHGLESTQASYISVIIAWGRSGDNQKFDRIKWLLTRYQGKVGAKSILNATSPNVYNAALSVCRHNSDSGIQAMDLLKYTTHNLRTDAMVEADETTYLTLFQAIQNLAKDRVQLSNMIEHEINFCINDGLVSKSIAELIHQLSPALFSSTFGEQATLDSLKIPRAWSKRLARRDAL